MSILSDAVFYLRFLQDPVGCLIRMHRENGAVTSYTRKGKPVVFMLGPQYNERILGDPETFHVLPITLPGAEGTAQRRIGQGLVNINGPTHKRHRRLLLPPLRGSTLAAHHEATLETVDRVLSKWRAGEQRDMLAEMNALAIRVSSATLFAMDEPDEGRLLAEATNHWFKQNTAIGVRLLRRDWIGTPYRRMARSAERVDQAMRSLIERRRALNAHGDDVLSSLLQASGGNGAQLSDDELIGELTIVFTASHETTSKTLTWTLFLLSQHPRLARAVADEIAEITSGDPPNPEQLARMTMLDRVIKESMRILPPVAFNVRRTSREADVLGYALPEGATTVFSHYVTHHLPEIYPEPERFRPNRWLDIDPSQYEYLPFSAGPRKCIGATFTLMVQKIILAMLIQRFRFVTVPNSTIDRSTSVTVSPRDGMPMTLDEPDRAFERVPVRGNIHEMVELTGPEL